MNLPLPLLLLLACEAPAPALPGEAAIGPTQAEGPRPVLPVHIELATVSGDFPRPVELSGLITLLVEMGLSDLPDTRPQVGGTPLPIGLREGLSPAPAPYRAQLTVSGGAAAAQFVLRLCDPQQVCLSHEASATSADPTAAAAALLRAAADQLGRHATPATEAAWGRPLSADPYAVLLLGRAAAALYGSYPAAEAEDIGHSPRDPIQRAAIVDPSMDEAWWVVSRQASALEDWPRARIAADRGLSAEPTRLALLADRAAILHRIGQADEAAVAYEGALAAAPRDPRLLRPAAAAALAAGDAEKADATLSLLSPTLADVDPAVAALRVAIADASGPASDALLEAWQTVDPTNPQPIRRRIMARVRARAYAEALPFTAELALRGAAAEARAVESGLALATGDLRRAATALDALGDPAAAQKVRARELLPRSPSAAAALLGSSADRPGQIALGHALLQDGDPSGARAAVAPVLAARPDDPDALAVEVLALRALGESEAAADALARLRWADPQLAI